jgi:hypothetical protein
LISLGIPKLVRFHKIRPNGLWVSLYLFSRRRVAVRRAESRSCRRAASERCISFLPKVGQPVKAVHDLTPSRNRSHSRGPHHDARAERCLLPYREGIEFPNPDFAALARACGGHGFRATEPGDLHGEIDEALKVDGPAVVDCVVAADEMPNLPPYAAQSVPAIDATGALLASSGTNKQTIRIVFELHA